MQGIFLEGEGKVGGGAMSEAPEWRVWREDYLLGRAERSFCVDSERYFTICGCHCG